MFNALSTLFPAAREEPPNLTTLISIPLINYFKSKIELIAASMLPGSITFSTCGSWSNKARTPIDS